MSEPRSPQSAPLPAWQAALSAAATASALGILEWALRRPEAPLELGARALGSVILVHASLGLGAGLVAQLWSRTRNSLSGAVGMALAALLPAAVFASGSGSRFTAVAVLAAAALLAPAQRALRRLPLTAGRLGLAHGAVLAGALVLLALDSAERRVPWPVVVLSGVAAGGLLTRRWLWVNGVAAAGLAYLLWTGLPEPSFSRPAPAGAPSVLLVTIDTLRADKLGFQGYASAHTPSLDALASEGRWFDNAQSLSSWTGPSHLTILTGRTPSNHGVLRNGGPLSSSVPTLGSLLSEAGWHTGAFVAGYPVGASVLGLRHAFHRYDDRFVSPGLEAFGSTITHGLHRRLRANQERRWRRSAADVNAAVLPWLEREWSRPFFAWVHYYDPHLPYEQLTIDGPTDGHWYALSRLERGEIARSAVAMAHMLALYDAQIAYTDRHLGQLVAAARRASDGNLWIVVTADHGESFGEHGLYFSRGAYEVTGRVPLILVPPRDYPLEPGRDERLVGLHDLAPTLLTALGLPVPEDTDGVDLLSDDLGEDRAIVKRHEPEEPGRYARVVSLRHGHHRLLEREAGWRGRTWSAAATELYDLADDPAETRDLAGRGDPAEAELRALLPRSPADGAPGSARALDDETRSALKALGYVD